MFNLIAVKYTEYIRIPPMDDSVEEQVRVARENNGVTSNNDPEHSVQYTRLPPKKSNKFSYVSSFLFI
jgi:hypothetical protein